MDGYCSEANIFHSKWNIWWYRVPYTEYRMNVNFFSCMPKISQVCWFLYIFYFYLCCILRRVWFCKICKNSYSLKVSAEPLKLLIRSYKCFEKKTYQSKNPVGIQKDLRYSYYHQNIVQVTERPVSKRLVLKNLCKFFIFSLLCGTSKSFYNWHKDLQKVFFMYHKEELK